MIGTAGVMMVAASLVLTRSRAAYLAFGAVLLVFLAAMFVSGPLRRHGRTWMRLVGILALAGSGVAAALLLPNTLRWRSENPYLETVQGVANYQEGSGRGRLVQYQRSLRMTAGSPLLGVGPGNWPVEYPEHAAPRDPSLDRREPGTTSNPWPSSDWIAFVSERGPVAAILLAIALLSIAAGGVRRLVGARDADEGLAAATLLATVVAAGVAGAFDAVLLLALPTLLVWAALGALWDPGVEQPATPSSLPALALVVVALAAGVGAARSTAQLAAMRVYATRNAPAALERAARIDPGSYRLRLARGGNQKQRCKHARAAHALFPSAQAARGLSGRCD